MIVDDIGYCRTLKYKLLSEIGNHCQTPIPIMLIGKICVDWFPDQSKHRTRRYNRKVDSYLFIILQWFPGQTLHCFALRFRHISRGSKLKDMYTFPSQTSSQFSWTIFINVSLGLLNFKTDSDFVHQYFLSYNQKCWGVLVLKFGD